MEWSNEKCIAFVEDYRSFTCLWKASDSNYKDKFKRGDAQQYLADKYKLPTRKAVLNKIKSFRPYFRKIHGEVTKKRSGAGRDDVISEPSWFLYKYLLFILDGEEDRPGKETFSALSKSLECIQEEQSNETPEEENENISRQSFSVDESQYSLASPPIVSRKTNDEDNSTPKQGSSFKKNTKITGNEKPKPAEIAVSLLKNVTENLKKRDHISAFSEYVEARIRNLKEPRTQTIAQMRINSLLFEIEMEQEESRGVSSVQGSRDNSQVNLYHISNSNPHNMANQNRLYHLSTPVPFKDTCPANTAGKQYSNTIVIPGPSSSSTITSDISTSNDQCDEEFHITNYLNFSDSGQ